jgi:3-oxoacyl-[acyl-carrier protein] reductase
MSTNAQKLAGKVAIVTGASKGIGANIALSLAEAGASVVVNYASSKEGADRVVDTIAKRGGQAVAVQGDVSKSADLDRLFAEAQAAFGRLDILVNNAGIYQFGALADVTEESFHRMFDLNVLGLLLASQKAAAAFGPEGGSIINVSSVAGVNPPAGASVYSATKGAVDVLTKALAKELGARKIRVNSLSPGMIETEGFHTAGIHGSELHQMIEKQTPLGRIGRPEDIGPVAVFLASDDSRWITGQIHLVSGGLV